jgi:hypothetical protein
MRDDNPGDLGIRFGFGRVYGMGPDAGKIKPTLEITDGTSGRVLTIELTAEDWTEMLASGEARIPAARVSGFKGVRDWGKFHHMQTRYVAVKSGDRDEDDPRKLPHVAEVAQELARQGYQCDKPRRNNQGQWVIIGRKYTDERQP